MQGKNPEPRAAACISAKRTALLIMILVETGVILDCISGEEEE